MTKSTITRERLEWLSQISCRDDIEDIGGDEIRELASMALAAMDSEPVAEITEDLGRLFVKIHYPTTLRAGDKLYRHAQPAPVVLKDHQIRELVNQLRDIAIEYHGTQQLRERIALVIRAAMLSGGKP